VARFDGALSVELVEPTVFTLGGESAEHIGLLVEAGRPVT
jgi:hypothetical protein